MLNDRSGDRSLTVPTTPISRSLSKSSPRALTVRPPPVKERAKYQTEDDISVQSHSQGDDRIMEPDDPFLVPVVAPSTPSQNPTSKLHALPWEILEGIVGHVLGHLGSTLSCSSNSLHTVRNWNTVMRHPRRKKVADLALISPTWRKLIQERIYRHIKIQGTKSALEECGDWFLNNSHLQAHVRHLEVLVPIWEQKIVPPSPKSDMAAIFKGRVALATPFYSINPDWTGESEGANIFQRASTNATMEEIFGCAQALFPLLCALTIEGGHCKNPPKVKYFLHPERNELSIAPFRSDLCHHTDAALDLFRLTTNQNPVKPIRQRRNTQPSSTRPHYTLLLAPPSPPYRRSQLSTLPSTTALILKGGWNLIRSSSDFSVLSSALPSLREFHCTYHKPKTGAYMAICDTLRGGFHSPGGAFPPTITHLDLCLEGLYTKPASSLKKWRKLYPAYHICRHLGALAPQLESLTYTGRVCHRLFDCAVEAAEIFGGTSTHLKSIDIVVSNVCREQGTYNDGTGINNWPFIQAFEKLVLHAVRSLKAYTDVSNLRVRFIDLENPSPWLNPMFHLEGDRAWGLFNDEILSTLREVRPGVRFADSSTALADEEVSMPDMQMGYPGFGKYRCVSSDYYKAMAHGGGHW